jgi:hypothetical protein
VSDDRRLLDRLVETIAPGTAAGDTDPRAATFTRGLVVGALVGAAIAGSTIWQRRQAKQHELGPAVDPGSEPAIPREPNLRGGKKPA